jgi:hypothetical protein
MGDMEVMETMESVERIHGDPSRCANLDTLRVLHALHVYFL